MNERHPVEHLSWAASTCFFLFMGYFCFEALAHLPTWFFVFSGFVFALTVMGGFVWFVISHNLAIHKVQHTDVPKIPVKKPRAPRVQQIQ